MKNHQRQDINGLLLLDKPKGLTSNQALQRVKRLFNAKKAGHTGSLDPLATGMLPICFGEGTKFSQYLLESDKTYEVTAKLGEKTATGDAEGDVIASSQIQHLTNEAVNEVLKEFKGPLNQTPSKYAAVKYQGKPLYQWTREGVDVPRKTRPIYIYDIQLLALSEPFFKLYVHCTKGTYIRTLVEDIAKALDNMAYVSELRRKTVAHFQEQCMTSMGQLEDSAEPGSNKDSSSLLFDLNYMLEQWTTLPISKGAAYYMRQGQAVIVPFAPPNGWVKITTKTGQLLGVAEVLDDGRVAPRRLVQNVIFDV